MTTLSPLQPQSHALRPFDWHICLVSEQAIPNYAPLLNSQLRPRKGVLLCVTQKMQAQAGYLSESIKRLGLQVERIDLHSEVDVTHIEDQLLAWLEQHDADTVTLNATGGNKLMAFTAMMTVATVSDAYFYVDHQQHCVHFFGKDWQPDPSLTAYPQKALPLKLQERITVDVCLGLYGYTTTKQQSVMVNLLRQRVIDELLNHVADYQYAIAPLNRVAADAQKASKNNLPIVSSPIAPKDWQALSHLLALMQQAALLRINHDQSTVTFSDEDSRFFVAGGWLEVYLQQVLTKLKSEGYLCDVANNIEIVSAALGGKGGEKNELDGIATTPSAQIILFECKTAQLGKGQSDKAEGVIYKLEGIDNRLGVLKSQKVLLSYTQLTDVDKQRTGKGVVFIESHQLRDLANQIKQKIGLKNNHSSSPM
jgi:hypothetical protein